MKIYIATRFEDKPLAAYWVKRLRDAGIEITHNWSAVEEVNDAAANPARRTEYAEADFNGVVSADLVWVLSPEVGGRGCWTEMGIALGRQIPVVLSGALGLNIFDEFSMNFRTHTAAFRHIKMRAGVQRKILA